MRDTQCADSGLQLDVDVMILEYLLFRAIEAQFQYLLFHVRDEVRASQASLAVSSFDCFIKVFNEQHPNHKQTTEFDFGIDILQFLFLLSSLVNIPTSHQSEAMLEKLQASIADDLHARRRWLAERDRQLRRREKRPASSTSPLIDVSRVVEQEIYATWNTLGTCTSISASKNTQALLLFSLLPRFMVISANFLPVINQVPTKSWMEVGCQLMLRAGLESLRLQNQDHFTANLPTLEDCFAWGYNDCRGFVEGDKTASDQAEDLSDLINNLFRDPTSAENRENPDWTQLRLNILYEFSIAADASKSSQTCRLERLADKYPLAAFQQKVVSTMYNIWELSCRDYIFGKPVLAEVEEGHLQSFAIEEGAEFEKFAARVGLMNGYEDVGEHVVTRRLENVKDGGIIVSRDIMVGLVKEESLRERYQHELLRSKTGGWG